MQVRFEQHLKLEINLPSSLMKTLIPPLALQMLVENAIKHNQISKENTLFIYISALDNTHLIVTNNKTTTIHSTSFKVGLQNIKDRYKFFTDQEIVIVNTDKYSVQLPLLKAIKPY